MAEEDSSSSTFFYADEDVFIGKKRTKREVIKSTLMGQNYESPVAKSSASSTNNLPDVISISSDNNSTDYKDLSSVSHDTDDIITISDDDEEGNKEVSVTAKQTTYDWEPLSSKETKTLGSVGLSIDALIEASEKLEAFAMDPVEDIKLNVVGKPSLDGIVSHLDFSLLTGVSESVLDISHGSSLSSPAVDRNDSSLGLLAMAAVYEDISCDGDHMFDTSEKQPKAEDNLHMSVDETDHMILGLDQDVVGSADATQPMFYKSCLSEFSNSAYNTANNTGDLAVCKQPSSSFSDYRDTFDDSCDLEGVNSVNFKYEANDNIKETSFEMVMNNRQNSFASTVATVTKTENTMEKTKPFISKLPVYNCTSNILKPSLLQGNLDSKLKARNFKWAKTLPKPCQTEPKHTNSEIKPKKIIVKTSTEKVINSEQLKQKTPAKSLSTQKLIITKSSSKCGIGPLTSNNSKTPRKALVNELIPKNTSTNKTSDKRALSQPTKLPKSDAKTPKVIRPPINHLLSSGKLNENKNLVPDQYKNVISPIRAYINNSPIPIQRKAYVPEKKILVLNHSARKVESHIPKSISTPLRGSSSKTSSASKVAQKLFNNKTQDQENVDPNYTRDTLPQRFFEAAAAVFMKEPEPPKRHLPKVGESMMKLIDTPRPKVIVHQGRVKESPRAKGVLIPSINIVPATPETSGQQATTDGRISIRVVKSADESDN